MTSLSESGRDAPAKSNRSGEAWPLWSRTMKHVSVSSTDQGGGKRRLIATRRLSSSDLPDSQENKQEQSRLPSFAISDHREDDRSVTSENACNSLRRDGRVVSCQPPAISSSSARANANAKIRLSQPASRTTPRSRPRTPAMTNPIVQAQCEWGAICLALPLISGGSSHLLLGKLAAHFGPHDEDGHADSGQRQR